MNTAILPADQIVCAPLHARLAARACVARQQSARLQPGFHLQCRSCEQGQRIAAACGLDPNGRDLALEAARNAARAARAGRNAHRGQGPGTLLDGDEEAA